MHWSEAFPVLHSAIAQGGKVHSFAAFEHVLRRLSSEGRSPLLDAEARQFLVFAYSFLQEQVAPATISSWRWTLWLAHHRYLLRQTVSFNYDLLLEHALESVGIQPFRYGIQAESQTPFTLKPHGSIDFATDPRAIFMPTQEYPMRNVATRNDAPAIALPRSQLRAPRQEAMVVLPAEDSPYLEHQWVRPAYSAWCDQARMLTHCVFAGLSDWECDRPEIDRLLGALAPQTTIAVANPTPPPSFRERVEASGRTYEEWPDGPRRLDN